MASESTQLRRWLGLGTEATRQARERLDAINVFPVADSDTGTNLYLTLREGNRAVALLPADASHREVVAAFARGCLLGARGNSGVIVSQYLSAFLGSVDRAGGLDSATGQTIADALDTAAVAAYRAVGSPVEGTILSVARAAARGGRGALAVGAGVEAVAIGAVIEARAELARTTGTLAEARDAGVVDAGAAGLLLQLDMLAETVAGPGALAAIDDVEWEVRDRINGLTPSQSAAHGSTGHAHGGQFEVMFLARSTRLHTRAGRRDRKAPKLSKVLKRVGDSVAVTGFENLWQAHVHTDDPERAVRVARAAGATQAIVRNIETSHLSDRGERGFVALTTCPGLAIDLAAVGAAVVVVPDPATLDIDELDRVIRDSSDAHVVVVAGSRELRAAAVTAAQAIAAAGSGKPAHGEKAESLVVDVLASESEPQLVAAMAAATVQAHYSDPTAVMRAAIGRCVAVKSSLATMTWDIEHLLTPDTEIAAIVLGAGIAPGVASKAVRRLEAIAPHVEVHVYRGNQSSPSVILGVEAALPG